MSQPLLCGVLTLTPTHCGTGQAVGAIDLPIAREVHTGLPTLPASTIKGMVREWFGLPSNLDQPEHATLYREVVKPLFGPRPPRRAKDGEPPGPDESPEESLAAGNVVFLEGMLLAFPVRSLTGVFRMVTAPMLIHRLRRSLAALGAPAANLTCPEPRDREVLLPSTQSGPLGLEDYVFPRSRCQPETKVDELASILGAFISTEAADPDRTSLAERLVVVSDGVLCDLVHRGTAVTARIVLDKDSKVSTNLWYEESLPPDTLFAVVMADRPGANGAVGKLRSAIVSHGGLVDGIRYSQIGGNVTVGQGWTRWHVGVEVGR